MSEFLSHLKAEGRSADTVRAYRADLGHLSDYLAATESPLDWRAAAGYAAWLRRSRPARAATQHRRLVAARALLRFLHHTSRLDSDLAGAIALPQVARGQARPADGGDVRLLLDAPDPMTWIGRRDHLMFDLMAHEGLSASEVCSLTFSDFNPVEETLSIPGRVRGSLVYLPRGTLGALVSLVVEQEDREDAPIFLSARGGQLSPRGLAQRLGYYCEMLGNRLSGRLTPQQLRDFAGKKMARTGNAELVAETLGYRRAETARERFPQLLRDTAQPLPLGEAAELLDIPEDKLRTWVEQGMPAERAETGEPMVTVAGIRQWGARPVPGGRDVVPPRPFSSTEVAEPEPESPPPIGEALVGLMGATTREEFHRALDWVPDTGPQWTAADIRARLEGICRQSLNMAAVTEASARDRRAEEVLGIHVATLFRGLPQEDLPLDISHEAFDSTFEALRAGLIRMSPVLPGYEAPVRMAYEHDERLLAEVEHYVASGKDLPGLLESMARQAEAFDEEEDGEAPSATATDDPFFRYLARTLVDTPASFRMWWELRPGSPAASAFLMLASAFAEELTALAEAGAAYYGLPDDDETGVAASGALMHAFLTAVVCACPGAVQAVRERTGAPSGAALLVLEHVKVNLLALWSAAGLLPRSKDDYLISAPRLLDARSDQEFCFLFERRWREVQDHSRGRWDYLVVPKLGVVDLLKYHNLVFGPGEFGSVHIARQTCDYLVYLTKASPQALLLSVDEASVARFVQVLYGIFAPLINSRYRKMLLNVADLTGYKARELPDLVSDDLPIRVRQRVCQLWKAFDFARGSSEGDGIGQGRGHTSFAAYLKAGLHRLFRQEQGKLLAALLLAPGSLQALDSEGDDEGVDGSSEEPRPRGAGHRDVIRLGNGQGAIRRMTITGPDGAEYLTTYWATVCAGCTARQLRSLDDELEPKRLHEVFTDDVPDKYAHLPQDTRLYRPRDFNPGEIQSLLFRRKHRCISLPEGSWTRGAVASQLGCSPQALVYWEHKGELEPVKTAECMAYDEKQVLKASQLLGKAEVAEEEQEETDLYEALMTEKPGGHDGYADEDIEGLTIIGPPDFDEGVSE